MYVLARSAWELYPSVTYGQLGFARVWAQKTGSELGPDAGGQLEKDN